MIATAVGAGRGARVLPLLAVAVALCACQSPKEPAAPGAPPGGGNVEAKLAGTGGSAANGAVVLHDARGGVNVAIWLGGVGPGQYRVAVHAAGNCSSPNGFSMSLRSADSSPS